MTDLVVVGSGLFGLTIAERAASQLGLRVLILEKRNHIGGNAYSEIDPTTGIEIHKYGSHIFHTSNERVWEYVNSFTQFNNYEHRVWTRHNNITYPMPINLETINRYFNRAFTEDEAREFMLTQSKPDLAESAQNLEDRAIGLIGKPMYEAFIKNYTLKQWQTDPRNLPADVINRLPVRFTDEHRYFNDRYEGIPISGYTDWLTNMASHPKIEIRLETDFLEIKDEIVGSLPVVYTGPIDKYFGNRFGQLTWRTLDFENEVLDISDYQGTSVINYADLQEPFTRIHEYKHFHPERDFTSVGTYISKEFSRFANFDDEPYYPVNTLEDRLKLQKYREAMTLEPDVFFGGRLGSYQYLDMHMAIASALTMFNNQLLLKFKGLTR